MVAFAIETGLRRAEQFNLRWSQIDMENRVLSLPMPKGSKSRYVPLTDGVCALLSGGIHGAPGWSKFEPTGPNRYRKFI
jgi:integrase